jgi:hypothetical protein
LFSRGPSPSLARCARIASWHDRVGPLTEQVGIPAPPEITFYDVHSYLLGPDIAG